MCGHVKYIVTDGSLFHGLQYNRINVDNTSDVNKTHDKILEYFHSFNNINIVLKRGNFEYEQAGRIQTFDEAKEIDAALIKLLDENGIEYATFDSGKESLYEIIGYILSKTN
jgi:hypothetical protein